MGVRFKSPFCNDLSSWHRPTLHKFYYIFYSTMPTIDRTMAIVFCLMSNLYSFIYNYT